LSERISCFVIMPFTERSNFVYQTAVLPALQSVKGASILPFRADEVASNLTIEAHAEGSIRGADFCVVNVTDTNPNVMYELGVAVALRKPVILIQEDKATSLPADLREVGLLSYSHSFMGEFRYKLGEEIQSTVDLLREEKAEKNQISTQAPSIYQHQLSVFLESFRSTLSALVESPEVLVETLLPFLKIRKYSEVRIRIACSNPESEFIRVRAEDSGLNVSQHRQHLWHQISKLSETLNEISGSKARTELRLIDSFVTSTLYISDDVALMVPYLADANSRSPVSIAYHRGRNSRTFDDIQRQFEHYWSRIGHMSSR